MTKRLLLEGRDWSNDIKKVLVTFQYTHVINTLYKQKSLHGLTLSSIQSTIKMFLLVYMYIHETISSFFFALNYSQEKWVTVCLIRKINVCQKRVKLHETRDWFEIPQKTAISRCIWLQWIWKQNNPLGNFDETFWGQNFRLFSFTQ